MNTKRIFMIGWEYPPTLTGGLAVACQGLARALARRGHRILFLTPRIADQQYHDEGVHLLDVQSQLRLFPASELGFLYENFQNPELETISGYSSSLYQPPGSGNSELDDDIDRPLLYGGYGPRLYDEVHKYALFTAKLARKLQFDVIHAHDWMTYPAALAAKEATGRPLVCHVHATEFDRSGDHVNQYVYDLERKAWHECTKVITVSNYTKTILIERYGVPADKIEAVHNAADFEMPEQFIIPRNERRPIDEKIVLFLGRMTFQKGPDYFVRAARKVIEQLRDVRFVMVGTGDMYHRMIELAADMGIGKYFHYTGFLNREQVQRMYRMSDLYVMPSVSEPFGLTSLEAMLHGVPVIVSRQSGVSEVISRCIKVDFWDVDELSGAIISVLSDENLSHELRSSGPGEARAITWNDSAARVEALYQSL